MLAKQVVWLRVMLAVFLLVPGKLLAVTVTSQGNGNWSNVGTWGGTLPQVGDDVVILSGTIVNLNQNTAVLSSLTIEPGAQLLLTVNGSGLKIAGNIVNDGMLTTWISSLLKSSVFFNANSYWSGSGSWNLGQIELNNYSWEFDDNLIIQIAENINGNPGSLINAGNRRSNTVLKFNGTENAVIPSEASRFFYPAITVDKPFGKELSFIDSSSPNVLSILGKVSILQTGSVLRTGQRNSIIINQSVSGFGSLSGSRTSTLTISGTGSAINALIIKEFTDFQKVVVTRPSGVVFANSFTILDEFSVAAGCSATLPSGSTLTLGENGASATAGNLKVDGYLFTGSLSNFSLRGNGTSTQELKFFQGNAANYSLANLKIDRSPGAGAVTIPSANSLIINETLEVTAANNLFLGNGKLYLNKGISIDLSGYLTGSDDAELFIQGTGGDATLYFNQNGNESNHTLKNLIIDRSSSNKKIYLGNSLLVKENITLGKAQLYSNGYLTLPASASKSANIAPIPSGSKVLGDVNIQVWFTGGDASLRGTRSVASPINDSTTTFSTFRQLKNYMLITGSGTGFEAVPPAPATPTLYTYKESASYAGGSTAQFNIISDINAKSPPGQGFFLLYRGNRTDNVSAKFNQVNGEYAVPESFAVTFTGPVTQGEKVVDLSFTNRTDHPLDAAYNGYNLVGNPYPSIIDWTQVLKTNAEDLVSVIKPGGGMITYSNGIVTNGGPPPNAPGSAITSNLPYIQIGQGFYVKARNASASLTFKESCKAIDKTPARLLRLPEQQMLAFEASESRLKGKQRSLKVLRISLQDDRSTDETAIVFKEGFDAAYAEADAIYFSGSSVSLSSLSADGKSLAINFMPDISKVRELKLNVNSLSNGNLKLNFTDLSGALNFNVMLEDNYLHKLTDVRKEPVYRFCIDRTNAATYGDNRFRLLFSAPEEKGLQLAGMISVYPNPATDEIFVNAGLENIGRLRLNVFDVRGRMLLSSTGTRQNISGLDHGLYLLEVTNADTNQFIGRTRFIK